MIQLVMAHAIMVGMLTEAQADEVTRRLISVRTPGTATETWAIIKTEMERVKKEIPDQ